MFGNIIPNIFGVTRQLVSSVSSPWALQLVRGKKIRNYFPRPSETMRVRKHGWDTRMSTLGGRKILMRRILKGRHVLSH